jgi:hypothetical protein
MFLSRAKKMGPWFRTGRNGSIHEIKHDGYRPIFREWGLPHDLRKNTKTVRETMMLDEKLARLVPGDPLRAAS